MKRCTYCTLGDEPGCDSCLGHVEPEGEPKRTTIYRIRHVPSGRIYIGVHATEDDDDGYQGSGDAIKAAVDKHGWDEFEKAILVVLSTEEAAYAIEAAWVGPEQVRSRRYFNLKTGGRAPGAGQHSEETKARISTAGRKRFEDPAELEKHHAAMLKRYEDPAEVEKQRAGTLKRYEDPAEREKSRARQVRRYEDPAELEAQRARCRTPQARAKTSAAMLAHYENPAEVEKNRAAQLKRNATLSADERRAMTSNAAEANRTPAGRAKCSAGGKRAWDRFPTKEARSAEMKRRAAVAKAERARVRSEVAQIFAALIVNKYGGAEAA